MSNLSQSLNKFTFRQKIIVKKIYKVKSELLGFDGRDFSPMKLNNSFGTGVKIAELRSQYRNLKDALQFHKHLLNIFHTQFDYQSKKKRELLVREDFAKLRAQIQSHLRSATKDGVFDTQEKERASSLILAALKKSIELVRINPSDRNIRTILNSLGFAMLGWRFVDVKDFDEAWKALEEAKIKRLVHATGQLRFNPNDRNIEAIFKSLAFAQAFGGDDDKEIDEAFRALEEVKIKRLLHATEKLKSNPSPRNIEAIYESLAFTQIFGGDDHKEIDEAWKELAEASKKRNANR